MLCQIGPVEIWRILEIHAPFLPPEMLFPTAGSDVARIIEAHRAGQICPTSGKLIIPIQGFLLKTPNHLILVDACVGNHKTVPGHPSWHQRNSNRFTSALTAAGVEPDDVDYVLCTHLHTDHVGWNTRLEDGRWVPTFRNARYLLPAADQDFHQDQNSDLYRESVLPVIEAGQSERVSDDYALGDFVRLVPTPGHTPGHVSVLVDAGAQQALITGDAIHTTAQCSYPDWHFKFDADPERAVTSRRALLEQASDRGCKVIGTHFALPSIGRVSAQGDAFKWKED